MTNALARPPTRMNNMANVDVVNIIIDVERQDLEREELLLSAVDVRKEVASSNAGMSLLERSSSTQKKERRWSGM